VKTATITVTGVESLGTGKLSKVSYTVEGKPGSALCWSDKAPAKGATLADISRIVEEISRAIRDRKAHLAPQIASLRSARAEFSDLESQYIRERAAEGKIQFVVISLKDTFYHMAHSLVGVYRDRSDESSDVVTLDLESLEQPPGAAEPRRSSAASTSSFRKSLEVK
jgi:hypothetical protein